MTAGQVHEEVTEYGTGLLRTSVSVASEGGFRWRRSTGPLAPASFERFVPALAGELAGIGELPDARLVPGTGDDTTRTYLARGSESVAGLLLREGADDRFESAMHALGRLLAAVHAHRTEHLPSPATAPRGLVRLGDWLSGRARGPRAAYAESLLVPGLGADRLATARMWCARLTTETDVVLSHGSAGLGSLVPGAEPGTVDLLIGEDVCVAPWYFDLGWVAGELIEFKGFMTAEQHSWHRLLDALFRGYGHDLGDEWAKMAALRVLLHVHDYVAYVAWSPELFTKYLDFLKFLIDL